MSNQQNLKATHQGELDLNGFVLSCAVLHTGERLFSERSLANAFGIKGGGSYWKKKKNESANLPEYLSAGYLKEFISSDLIAKFESAYTYTAINGTKAICHVSCYLFKGSCFLSRRRLSSKARGYNSRAFCFRNFA